MSTTTRTDRAAGPVWLPPHSADCSRDEHAQGAWSLVIEQRRVIGRIGWLFEPVDDPAPFPATAEKEN